MAGGKASSMPAAARTPAAPKKATGIPSTGKQSTGKQQSILGFFGKSASTPPSTGGGLAVGSKSLANQRRGGNPITPVPSSDVVEPQSSQENASSAVASAKVVMDPSLPSPVTPAERVLKQSSASSKRAPMLASSSPSRKTRKAVNYAESDEDEDDPFERLKPSRSRRDRRRVVADDDEDEYDEGVNNTADHVEDDDMDDFVVSDESDAASKSRKRKRAPQAQAPRKKSNNSSPRGEAQDATIEEVEDVSIEDIDVDTGSGPSEACQQWRFDEDDKSTHRPVKKALHVKSTHVGKAHEKDPEQRYSWLANMLDLNRNPPSHPDYDPTSVYVPPSQWTKFSAFEKQYWEIKQKLWDTIVFFKKGKFYELYENDATVGHQLFDLKLTDRVNMRMVGVPESSLDQWVNQFVARGYKVARVDQMESALGKEMRERDGAKSAKSANKKVDKIIRRELACVLTGGTLVDGSMLQDDMATYCAAIKESSVDDKPSFGIAFVDAATGRFSLSEFEDDVDLTKFQTFVAQTSPRELVLEKSHLSTKALRILKNNTSPTTIWSYRKSGTEFWDADQTRVELKLGNYWAKDGEDDDQEWPGVLKDAKGKNLVMSAFGALVQYLQSLKLERNLVSQGNFEWYSPIHRDGTLILDGQTLMNLEIFSNTVDGGPDGTLFSLLNRCVTPFGKRLFRQWVCHPLCNIARIDERLDAVDMLNQDRDVRDQFTSQMTRMPDLERLISRVHAGAIRADNFVKVLDGFELMECTMRELKAFQGGNGLLDRLISGMPDLSEPLAYWQKAFDKKLARDEKTLVPTPGMDPEYDQSQEAIDDVKRQLDALLNRKKKELGNRNLKFTDIGKEVYQIEAPKSVKVPSSWKQMSATAAVKRYYFTELTDLVRALQEVEETHAQVTKETASRFFSRFDDDYATWLTAIRVVAQLDCLVGLAKASTSLGQPSCRPVFVDAERSVVEFSELRHPCMQTAVDDFIPNDVHLGGAQAKIGLLTGANAAGKSTVLRMSCVAVIMAQVGCHVPAAAARLTPVDRIMSRLGANDNIFAAQSTFFVELSETKKILSEATDRSLVILDELGRGTSSYDGVAVAQAVLHHVATHVGCVGFFATHYRSLAAEFEGHPEISPRRMQIDVDAEARRVTFLYRLEEGVAEGSFGMHCAAMCGIPAKVVDEAERAAKEWEHTSRLKESLDKARTGCYMPLGVLSDVGTLLRGEERVDDRAVEVLLKAIEAL